MTRKVMKKKRKFDPKGENRAKGFHDLLKTISTDIFYPRF